jgi:transcriptional regulator of acetoin/glycerol metabolism
MRRPDHRRHAELVFAAARDNSAAARSLVAASWIRSLTEYGLDPEHRDSPQALEPARLGEARDRMGPLLRAAQPALDRLFEAVGNSGCCVLLTDPEGVPLDRRGEPGDDAMFRSAGLWTGMVWHEMWEGTNGVGTVIAEGRPLTIHHDQHFFTRHTGLSCTAAPLFDHQGELAGVLDVSSCRGDVDAAAVSLISMAVGEAVRRIETANFRQAYQHVRIVLGPGAETSALLAIDRDDLVVGATRAARRAYRITPAQIAAGLPADAVLGFEEDEAFAHAERGVVQRALARAGGNVSEAARALGVSRATLHRKLSRLGVR